jgi:uncharacterized membrane protein YbhN (UPF0104 family)
VAEHWDQPSVLSAPEAGTADLALGQRLLRWRTLASFLVAFAIMGVALSQVRFDLGRLAAVLGQANLALMALALGVYYLVFPARACRWRLMLLNAGMPAGCLPSELRLAVMIFLSWFANCLVPAKLGDLYRAYLFKRQTGLSLSKAGGTIVAERLLDFAVVLVLLGITGLVAFRGQLPEGVVRLLEVGLGAMVLAGLGLLALRRLGGLVEGWLPGRARDLFRLFREGTLGAFGRYHFLVGLTLVSWLAEAGRLFLVTRAVGIHLHESLLLELLTLTFIALGAALLTAPPGTPAGLGYVEASITWAFILLGLPPEVALSLALLDRAISYLSLVVLGVPVYLLMQRT